MDIMPLSKMSEGARVVREAAFGRMLAAHGGAWCIEWVSCLRLIAIFWFRLPDVSLPMTPVQRKRSYRVRLPDAPGYDEREDARRVDDGITTIIRLRMHWARIAPGPLATFVATQRMARAIQTMEPVRKVERVA